MISPNNSAVRRGFSLGTTVEVEALEWENPDTESAKTSSMEATSSTSLSHIQRYIPVINSGQTIKRAAVEERRGGDGEEGGGDGGFIRSRTPVDHDHRPPRAPVLMQPPVHTQLAALCLSLVSWTLGVASLGVVEWRAWHVADRSVVTSGVAAVGVWRTCFHSHVLVSPGLRVMYCRGMGVAEGFLPDEITAVQVVVPLGLAVGLGGNAAAVAALRGVYVGQGWGGARAFFWAGGLCALSALLSLGPLAWNLHSMLGNQTIAFPPEFNLPAAPVRQSPGVGVIVATAAAVLMLISGIMFLCYRPPPGPRGPSPSRRRPVGGGARHPPSEGVQRRHGERQRRL
ncbi:unnamed protein product [Boreogadus saida]